MYREDIAAFVPRTPAEAADKEQILYYVNQYADTILTRENRLAHITASGFILSADGQWVLMAHHNIYKVWACGKPGRRRGRGISAHCPPPLPRWRSCRYGGMKSGGYMCPPTCI